MPQFDRLVPDALGFFEALAANNTRDWFTANKARYLDEVKQPADTLLGEVGAWLAAETGTAPVAKLYRINRDLRFSKDKTPYNTHLHLQWSDPGTGISHLFGVSRDYVCAGVGAMGFDKAALGRWRDGVAGPAGSTLAARVAALVQEGHRLDPPELKRVPAPYGQDHPNAELLKRKGIVLWHDFGDAERARPMETLRARFAALGVFRETLAGILSV